MRQTVLLVLAYSIVPAIALADTPQDTIENLAIALQKGDAHGALELFDARMSGFAELKSSVEAWSKLPNTDCAIAIAGTKQSQDSVTFETDWSLRTSSIENGPLLDRSDRVSISLRQSGNAWLIVSLNPLSILVPPDDSIFTLVARLAADLNDKNESGALGAFDSSMKQFGEIDNDIDALVTQNDLLCAIDVISDKQTGDTHKLDLDWFLKLKSRADGGPVQERRERVQLQLRRTGRKWQILSIEPLSILSPEVTH